jgi:proteasome accessory factor A
MKIFDRLIGLETEYAIRFRPHFSTNRPTDHQLYSFLVGALKRKLPTASPGLPGQGKEGVFLANGGAVWFERCRFAGQTGLVEGSTPECRSPRQLLICQRAQDRLLSETAHTAGIGDFCLLKNCRDSQGQSYGAQENYEATLATGWRLLLWRAGWILLYPLNVIQFIVFIVLLVALLAILFLANSLLGGLVYALVRLIARPSEAECRRWQERIFGRFWVTRDDADAPWPPWLEEPLFVVLQLGLTPFFFVVSLLVGLTDLRRTQQRLTAFLASRAVLGGSGWLDAEGHFHLTEKAETRRTVWLETIPDFSRPVFSNAHFCKMVSSFWPRWKELLASRQRMQISLGDSNLCEEAEYLRVATTLLVLDAIEAGAIGTAPTLRRPLRAFRQISRDPTLTTAVAVRGGRRMTALEIQRWYLDACRRFVDNAANPPGETHEVLRRWADVLDRLETDRSSLVGRLDWVTKQFLLDEAGADLPYTARKKIDLRYHELSPGGYFSRLEAAGQTTTVATTDEVAQAMRLPPSSSPALRRARYIREFSGSNTVLRVGWRFLEVIKQGGKKTTIDLHEPLLWD